jgi:putative spermidine/putrescine transport system substrate-binding protein
MDERRKSKIGRRAFIGAGASVLAAPYVLRWDQAVAQSRPLVFVSWGGSYQEAQETAIVKPFTKDTGIQVTMASGPDLAKLRAQAKSGNVEWDIFDGTGPMITAGEREDLWHPLDKSIVNTAGMLPGAARASSIGICLYAGGIGFDPKRHPEGKHPRDFAQLWDADKFPGRRGFRTRISETLEMALLADGVEPAKLYPLDVERGFKSLDRIKKHVSNWIAQTPQTISLIQSNEVDFTYTYSGRVLTAQRSGVSVDFSFDQTINSMQYLAVPKGSRQKDAAMRLLDYSLRDERQAQFAEVLSYIPSKAAAIDLMTPDAKKRLPDLKSPKNAIVDDEWWADHFAELEKRFKEWQLT